MIKITDLNNIFTQKSSVEIYVTFENFRIHAYSLLGPVAKSKLKK